MVNAGELGGNWERILNNTLAEMQATITSLRAENEALKSKLNKLRDEAVRQAHNDYQLR